MCIGHSIVPGIGRQLEIETFMNEVAKPARRVQLV